MKKEARNHRFFIGVMSHPTVSGQVGDAVPLAARGFLLAIVVCLHVVGAAALLYLQALPQRDETPMILQANWIVSPPSLAARPVDPIARRPHFTPSPTKTTVRSAPAVAKTSPVSMEPKVQENIQENAMVQEDSISTARDVSTAATTNQARVEDGNGGEPDFGANDFSNPKPSYPVLSRRLREQGVVKLRVQVTAEGTAGEVALHASSGYERLDKAALDAVKHWRFRQTSPTGAPVGWVIVPIRFELRD
ncbi:MAG: TonB family protein [Betaproteobacteria bacterium]|nr:TonB family protein [Betaproteobacteria bacterium]